jgi:hypothetical protein
MAREQQKHHFKGKNNDAKRPGRFEPKGKGQKKP